MDSQKLIAAGLQPLQAKAYALLLEEGNVLPNQAVIDLKVTRTNAYKILDNLVDMGLAKKDKVNKKLTYSPDNPLALAELAGEERNKIAAREDAVKTIMDQLLERYYEKTEQPSTTVVTGREAVANAYKQQIALRQPLYFIRSKADIASLGFETMHDIRVLPAHYKQQRFGITPDVSKGPTNPEADKRSNLTRTWVRHEDYTAPVEWSVSGSILLIVLFGSEPHAITIVNPIVADAFRQIWHIMDTGLKAMPGYKTLPRSKNLV